MVKSTGYGKRGRTFQGYVMDAWNKHRDIINKIDESERKTSA